MKKKLVAITGGIGSGKSLALQFLRKLNYPVFSCDEIYKEVIVSKEYIELLEKSFPNVVKNGQVDRTALAETVFNNEIMRIKLNNLAHPIIMKLLLRYMEAAEGSIAFAEVPLLFEGNFEKIFDHVLYIARDKQLRIEAVNQRDGLLGCDVEKRIASQFDGMSMEGQRRLKECNAKVIYNSGGKDEFKKEILAYLETL